MPLNEVGEDAKGIMKSNLDDQESQPGETGETEHRDKQLLISLHLGDNLI